mmetsp:Transcript_21996/g.46283  ORF Transcript_21996/g.46283 Transcript_21996/m.46283 type:complete len:208 (+) Transcript_21996:565-1188(+)
MDSKTNFFASSSQSIHHIFQGILTLCNGKPITRNDDDTLAFHQKFASVIDISLSNLSLEFHRLSLSTGLGAVSSKNDTENVSVHCIAHDLCQCRSTATNQSANCCHDRHIEHESLGTESPTGVGVQYCDNNRHVGTSDRCSHMPTESTACCQCATECCKPGTHFRASHHYCSSAKSCCTESHIDLITRWVLHRSRRHSPIQFSKCDK